MRTVLVAVVLVVTVIVAAVIYQQYRQRESVRNLTITLEDVRVESVGLTGAELAIAIRATNPGPVAATIDRTSYVIFVNNISLGEGQNLQKVTVPAGGSVVIAQPISVTYSGAVSSAWSYLTAGEAEWRLVGTAYIDTPLGQVSVPYDETGTF